MATETMRINLTRDFNTNGETIPAGVHELPKEQAEDLMRRQAQYDQYREGITEKREYMSNAGNIAGGSNEG